VFPALDPDGAIQYLQARYLDPGDGPKYDNPAAALGTNPRLAWTRSVGPERPGVLIICEGIPDALTAAVAGFRSAAVLGSQAPDQSVASRLAGIARRHALELVAVVDNDAAGAAWGARLSEFMGDAGHDLRVLEPPDSANDLNACAADDCSWTEAAALLPSLEAPMAVEHW
ncbi:MAG: toprim domain-containing protein, partial [Microthrixaceae bacterium]